MVEIQHQQRSFKVNNDIKVNIVKQKKTYYLPVVGSFASAPAVKLEIKYKVT
jgi:hypothetical protein